MADTCSMHVPCMLPQIPQSFGRRSRVWAGVLDCGSCVLTAQICCVNIAPLSMSHDWIYITNPVGDQRPVTRCSAPQNTLLSTRILLSTWRDHAEYLGGPHGQRPPNLSTRFVLYGWNLLSDSRPHQFLGQKRSPWVQWHVVILASGPTRELEKKTPGR